MNTSLNRTGLGLRTTTKAALLAALLCTGLTARAQTVSELLEKGIYTEETKGDLDAAIELYGQVVSGGKTAQAVAAQAQFRLGLCYLKKNMRAEAEAAVAKLAKEYPEEKELIAKARQYVPGDMVLLPVSWPDGELLQLDLKLGGGLKIGTAIYFSRLIEREGRSVLQVGSRMAGGAHSFSRVELDPVTFRPIHSVWNHDLLGEAETYYKDGQAELTMNGKDKKVVALENVIYDNEEAILLMRRLPLAVGYTNTMPVFSSLAGGAIIPVGLEVTKEETLEVPAGKIRCFRVELSIKQTFWIAVDGVRELAKFEGGGVVAELAKRQNIKASTARTVRNEQMATTLTLPQGWEFFEPDNRSGSHHLTILVDRNSSISIAVEGELLESLKPDQSQSLRAWAEEVVKQEAQQFKDFKMRPEGLKDAVIGGRQGLRYTADITDKEKPRVVEGAFVFGAKSAVAFLMNLDKGAAEKGVKYLDETSELFKAE